MRFSGLILITVLLFAAVAFPEQTSAQEKKEKKEPEKSYLYQWTDGKGVVHITDSLGTIPEKYRDKAVKLESPKKDETEQRDKRVYEPSAPVDEESAQEDAKAEWQQRMKEARKRLVTARQRYQELDRKHTELMGAWGGSAASGHLTDPAEAERVEQEMKKAQQDIDDAQNEVENVIPEAARRAGVPPGWLRE
jgi:uncharacterized protein YukE